MKKTMRFLSMAALTLVGALMTGCSSDDNEPQQPANTGNVETLTMTVSLDGEGTRALDNSGEKTFAAGETMAIVYKNTSGNTVKAVSKELEADNIESDGLSATFTFELTDPDKTKDVTYIYPAAMAKDNGDINYDALATQNGTLATLSSSLDLATYSGAWDGAYLPAGTLVNPLAVCALTLKNSDGSSPITSGLTQVTVSDGSNTYTVAPTSGTFGEDVIYVAILPVTAALEYTATDGTTNYTKTATSKEYAAGNFYNLGLRMAEAAPTGAINGKFSVSSTKQVYFSKGNLQASTNNNGESWTWAFAEHQWDKIGGKDQDGAGTQTGNNYINGNGTLSANGTVDLFGWSTSATHLGIHNSTNNNHYSGDFVDWGSAKEVYDCIGTGWRTLTQKEWEYLLCPSSEIDHRNTTSGMLYYKAQVNGVNGLIVFPDNWSTSYHTLTASNVNNNAISFESTKITESVWNTDFASHGAVFLPVAGQRHVNNNYVEYPNGRGHYWSSTPYDTETAYRLYFTGSSSGWSYGVSSSRRFGYSVRLVRDAN